MAATRGTRHILLIHSVNVKNNVSSLSYRCSSIVSMNVQSKVKSEQVLWDAKQYESN